MVESTVAAKKQITITKYDPNWPTIFTVESAKIKKAIGRNCLEVHHIGSTSVPGMTAKQDIDILCIVDELTSSLVLEKIGYIFKEELNVPLRYFFSKNSEYSKVNLHVVEPDHGFIALNLCFRDYLRNNQTARLAYETLKLEILRDQNAHKKLDSGFVNYTLRKDCFVKRTLKCAGFNQFCINFCMHKAEWHAYHRISEQQIFMPINVVYDRNHPNITANNHYHFVLYKGIEIVSIAHVEFIDADIAALRSLATDEPYKHQGFATHMMQLLEKWIKRHGRSTIKLHAALRAKKFYRKLGYTEIEFNDKSISNEVIDLGKIL